MHTYIRAAESHNEIGYNTTENCTVQRKDARARAARRAIGNSS